MRAASPQLPVAWAGRYGVSTAGMTRAHATGARDPPGEVTADGDGPISGMVRIHRPLHPHCTHSNRAAPTLGDLRDDPALAKRLATPGNSAGAGALAALSAPGDSAPVDVDFMGIQHTLRPQNGGNSDRAAPTLGELAGAALARRLATPADVAGSAAAGAAGRPGVATAASAAALGKPPLEAARVNMARAKWHTRDTVKPSPRGGSDRRPSSASAAALEVAARHDKRTAAPAGAAAGAGRRHASEEAAARAAAAVAAERETAAARQRIEAALISELQRDASLRGVAAAVSQLASLGGSISADTWAAASAHLGRYECGAVARLQGKALTEALMPAAAASASVQQKLGASSGLTAGGGHSGGGGGHYSRALVDLEDSTEGGAAAAAWGGGGDPATAAAAAAASGSSVPSHSLDALALLTRVPRELLQSTQPPLLSALADLAAVDLTGARPSAALRLAATLAAVPACGAQRWHMDAVAACLLAHRPASGSTGVAAPSLSLALLAHRPTRSPTYAAAPPEAPLAPRPTSGPTGAASRPPPSAGVDRGQSIARLSTGSLASLLAACAVLGYRNVPLLNALAPRLVEGVGRLYTPGQLISVAGAYAQLRHPAPALAHALAQRTLECAPHWDDAEHPRGAASLAGALAGMGADEPRALAALLRLAGSHAVNLGPRDLAHGMAACLAAAPPAPFDAAGATATTAFPGERSSSHASSTSSRFGARSLQTPPPLSSSGGGGGADAPARADAVAAARTFADRACVQLRFEATALSVSDASWVLSACARLQHADPPMLRALASVLAARLDGALAASADTGAAAAGAGGPQHAGSGGIVAALDIHEPLSLASPGAAASPGPPLPCAAASVDPGGDAARAPVDAARCLLQLTLGFSALDPGGAASGALRASLARCLMQPLLAPPPPTSSSSPAAAPQAVSLLAVNGARVALPAAPLLLHCLDAQQLADLLGVLAAPGQPAAGSLLPPRHGGAANAAGAGANGVAAAAGAAAAGGAAARGGARAAAAAGDAWGLVTPSSSGDGGAEALTDATSAAGAPSDPLRAWVGGGAGLGSGPASPPAPNDPAVSALMDAAAERLADELDAASGAASAAAASLPQPLQTLSRDSGSAAAAAAAAAHPAAAPSEPEPHSSSTAASDPHVLPDPQLELLSRGGARGPRAPRALSTGHALPPSEAARLARALSLGSHAAPSAGGDSRDRHSVGEGALVLGQHVHARLLRSLVRTAAASASAGAMSPDDLAALLDAAAATAGSTATKPGRLGSGGGSSNGDEGSSSDLPRELLALVPSVLSGTAAQFASARALQRLLAAAGAGSGGGTATTTGMAVAGSGTAAGERAAATADATGAWQAAAARVVRARAPRLQPSDLMQLVLLLAGAQPTLPAGAHASALAAANRSLADVVAPVLVSASAQLPEEQWAPAVLALHRLGHTKPSTYAALADDGARRVRSSWGAPPLIGLMHVYADAGLHHAALLGALARCLVLRTSGLGPEQLVDAADALAGVTGSGSAAPGRGGGSGVGGSGGWRGGRAGDDDAAAAASVDLDASGGVGGGGGGSVWTQGWAARVQWALQLHRALALQAHQTGSEYSVEQLLRLLRASLRAGACHTLLFRDVVRRYLLQHRAAPANLQDLQLLSAALACTRSGGGGGGGLQGELEDLSGQLARLALDAVSVRQEQAGKPGAATGTSTSTQAGGPRGAIASGTGAEIAAGGCLPLSPLATAELLWALGVTASSSGTSSSSEAQASLARLVAVLGDQLLPDVHVLPMHARLRLAQILGGSHHSSMSSSDSSSEGGGALLAALARDAVGLMVMGEVGGEVAGRRVVMGQEGEEGDDSEPSTSFLDASGTSGSSSSGSSGSFKGDSRGGGRGSTGGAPAPSLREVYVATAAAAYARAGGGDTDAAFLSALAQHCMSRARAGRYDASGGSGGGGGGGSSGSGGMSGPELAQLGTALAVCVPSQLRALGEAQAAHAATLLLEGNEPSSSSWLQQVGSTRAGNGGDARAQAQQRRAKALAVSAARLAQHSALVASVLRAAEAVAGAGPGVNGPLASCSETSDLEVAVAAFLSLEGALALGGPGQAVGVVVPGRRPGAASTAPDGDAHARVLQEGLQRRAWVECERAAKAASARLGGLEKGRERYHTTSRNYHKMGFPW
ncbi:hypothetical protein FOA52_008016 [Chlamydomonas sp. UWO 241]|nr:hypothetical protein FOA52_008016 [Chlamydomonas sp. UWO 241]